MIDAPKAFRRLLAGPKPIFRPAVADPFAARVAEKAGFQSVIVGGYVLGTQSCAPEPLLDLSRLADAVRRIQAAITIPVIADAGGGFGEAIQVWQTVRMLEDAGAAGMQLEDQTFPKRAHYHRDYQETTIDHEHMLEKLMVAREARRNPDFVILARTDAMKTVGFAEGVRRANLYAEAGADIVMTFPNTIEETRQAPKEISAPLAYVVSHGNRVGRPVLRAAELVDMGYKVISYSIVSAIVVYQALDNLFRQLAATGTFDQTEAQLIQSRNEIESLLGLEELYQLEEKVLARK